LVHHVFGCPEPTSCQMNRDESRCIEILVAGGSVAGVGVDMASPSQPHRIVFLLRVPFFFTFNERLFHTEFRNDASSRQCRVFAVDVEEQKAGQGEECLLAAAATEADLNELIYTTGIVEDPATVRSAMFMNMIRDGLAKDLRPF
jgi:hypothetical protein